MVNVDMKKVMAINNHLYKYQCQECLRKLQEIEAHAVYYEINLKDDKTHGH
jgi:hypothetical protein